MDVLCSCIISEQNLKRAKYKMSVIKSIILIGVVGILCLMAYIWCMLKLFTAFPITIPILIFVYLAIALYFSKFEPQLIEDDIVVDKNEISEKG